MGRVFESPRARSNFSTSLPSDATLLPKRSVITGLSRPIAGLFPFQRGNLALLIKCFTRLIDIGGFRLIRLVCFRQSKNLTENLGQTLRSFCWNSHHFPDVADAKLCLLPHFFSCPGLFLPDKRDQAIPHFLGVGVVAPQSTPQESLLK